MLVELKWSGNIAVGASSVGQLPHLVLRQTVMHSNATKQSQSWRAKRFSANQNILNIL